jgi:demethylmenaquinone methyltransferase/2-methoxy-6-polyprenyl-1,4-benzoquinol methylase
MPDESRSVESVDEMLVSQRRYYDLRAPDYADVSGPSDRKARGLLDGSTVQGVIDQLAPTGDVLELACGAGAFTRELARHARRLTCLDGSPRMLELNREIVGDPRIEYVCADIFEWRPQHQYDVVFFGFRLSHVPPTRFDDFWSLVEACLAPGGRVAFVDEDERAVSHEETHSTDDVPTARRRLRDGRTFDIVKVFWNEADLERRLSRAGWRAGVRPLAATCLCGFATRL